MPISVECCWVCYFPATSVANRALFPSRPCDMQGTAAPHFDWTAKMISNHLGQISSNPISLCKPCSDTIEASCLNNLCFCIRCKLLFVLDKNNSSSSARRNFFPAVLARKPGKTLFHNLCISFVFAFLLFGTSCCPIPSRIRCTSVLCESQQSLH